MDQTKESVFDKIDFMTSIVAGVFLMLTLALVLLGAYRKARVTIMEKFKEFKKQMLWNGVIETSDISYFNYCLVFVVSLLKMEENEGQEISVG